MPSPLDLSHSTHSKLMVAPPQINLRRAASYNALDRGPISSTSARFSFNHLLFSPPPSPSLPSLVPRHKKRPSQILVTRPSRVLRRLVYLAGLFLSVYIVSLAYRGRDAVPAVWPYFAQEEFEMVAQDSLPDFPTPIVASDSRGKSKWTVSIPQDYDFPLSVREYSDMSSQCREVSAKARDLDHKAPLSDETLQNYDAPDDYFVDVYDAERAGLLPQSKKYILAQNGGHFAGMEKEAMAKKPVCQSSMTFILETPDAGLGNSLMMMWTFYGLAKKQGRAFFVEDTRWAYGAYGEIFQAPPVPECRPPPRHHMVPCPFQARHLIVSAVTAKEIFPALLAQHHRITKEDNGLRDLFELARTGYEDTFALNEGDQTYVMNRVRQIREKPKVGKLKSVHAPVMGLHIRHGDQHPLEYQYRDGYIPNEVFLGTVQDIIDAHYNKSGNEVAGKPFITLLASDDPTVLEEPDFTNAVAAQDRIRLASKGAIEEANNNPHVLHQFVDETFGWEGGFFAPMFWNLGAERKNNAANAPTGQPISELEQEEARPPPSEETLKLRSLIGRAYMMDLAVVSGASDNVVCAVSAMGCRLLAVMMGWEHAMDLEGWKNVDGTYEWTGVNW